MKFLLIVTLLTHTIHSFALRSSSRPQILRSRNKFSLFHSQTSRPNQVKLEDYVDKTFEANWDNFKDKVPDLSSIFADYLSYYEDIDNKFARSELLDALPSAENGDNYDVKITCSSYDMGLVLSHRSILSASSPVFKQYLSTATTTNGILDLHIHDIDKEVLKEILIVMYTLNIRDDDCVNILFKREDIGEKLLYTALKYKINPLINIYDIVLAENVDSDNKSALSLLSSLFDLEKISDACR